MLSVNLDEPTFILLKFYKVLKLSPQINYIIFTFILLKFYKVLKQQKTQKK